MVGPNQAVTASRYNAVRCADGWYPTRRGCPVLAPLWELGVVTGLQVLAGGRWLRVRTVATPS
jgi:hypothetical protein